MRTCTRLTNPPKGRSWGGGEQIYFPIVTEWAQFLKTQPVWDIISSAFGVQLLETLRPRCRVLVFRYGPRL